MTLPAEAVVLVTGGAGDIGLAIAELVGKSGATVVLADRDRGRLDDAARHLATAGVTAEAALVDLTVASECGGIVDSVVASHGRLDVLVNAAAVTHRGQIDTLPADAWDALLAVNLSSVYWTCRAAVRAMKVQGSGVIVNLASVAGVVGLPGSPAYAATKGGVVALSRALAVDHAPHGIRVHAVTPPAVDTRLYRAMFKDAPDVENARSAFEKDQVGGRVLTVDEIAALVAFLAHADGPFYASHPLIW